MSEKHQLSKKLNLSGTEAVKKEKTNEVASKEFSQIAGEKIKSLLREKLQSRKKEAENTRIKNNLDGKKSKTVDISRERYDPYLQVLSNWKRRDTETILWAIENLRKYIFSCIEELKWITDKVNIFHTELCKEDEKSENDQTSENENTVIEIDPLIFEKSNELRKRLKKYNTEDFDREEKLKKEIKRDKIKKKNLDGVSITVPSSLKERYADPKSDYRCVSKLYKSFVTYFPQAHTVEETQKKAIDFICKLFNKMRKKWDFKLNPQEMEKFVNSLCEKFKLQKYKENKRKMLEGQITYMDVLQQKPEAFVDFQAKKMQKAALERELKESEI